MNQLLPHEPTHFAGPLKCPQTSDIVFPSSLVGSRQLAIEKGLDYHNEAAAAEAYIRSYYDALSPLLVMRWLLDRCVHNAIAAAFRRLHVVPRIWVRFDEYSSTCELVRVDFSLVTANIAARIPIGDACQHLAPQLSKLGYPMPLGTFAVPLWVHNFTSLYRSASEACNILDLIRDFLYSSWAFDYKLWRASQWSH